MKILVLGGSGMVGHKLVQRLASAPVELRWTVRDRYPANEAALRPVPRLAGDGVIPGIDATRFEVLTEVLETHRPDAVINCVGVIKQRDEIADETLCVRLNAELPHHLVSVLSRWNGRLIHISTDCVFDGARGGYTEEHEPDAPDLYGRSKALGEVRAPNAITLRTSVIGRELRHHGSLLDWFLSQTGRSVRGFRSVRWNGVTSRLLAEIIERIAMREPTLTGVYHVASSPLSKYELLLKLRDAYRVDIDVVPDDSTQKDMTLVGSRFEQETGFRVPAWDVMLDDLANDPTPYRSLTGTEPLKSAT